MQIHGTITDGMNVATEYTSSLIGNQQLIIRRNQNENKNRNQICVR